MRVEHPELWWVVPALALAAAALVLAWHARRRAALAAFGHLPLLQRLTRADLLGFPARRLALLSGGAAAIGLALVNPQWGARTVESAARGLDAVFAFDVSASMRAADLVPDRLERARTEARRLLREMPGDRVGLVVFAGRAYVLAPLTSDHGALEMFLDALDPEVAGTPGTSLAAGIRQATEVLRGARAPAERVVVVFSDGEAHEPLAAVEAAAEAAREAGVRVYAVAVGTERGEPVPEVDPGTGRVTGYKRGPDGEIVLSRLNLETLARAAAITGGAVVRLDEGGVARLAAALAELPRAEGTRVRRLERVPRGHWFALLGFLCLALDAFAGTRRREET